MKTTSEMMFELIMEVQRLHPFEVGNDPYRNGQADTVHRVQDLLRRYAGENQ